MANLIATFRINLSYQGPGGGTINIPQKTYTIPYQADNAGHVDIPPTTPDGTEYAIPFGSVAEANAVWLINNTEQPLELKVNGGAVITEVEVGGSALILQSSIPGGVPLTALAVLTTALTVAAGRVDYFVFGDPS